MITSWQIGSNRRGDSTGFRNASSGEVAGQSLLTSFLGFTAAAALEVRSTSRHLPCCKEVETFLVEKS